MNRIGGFKAASFAQDRTEEMLKGGRIVSELLLSSFTSFLERVNDAQGLLSDNMYSVFTFELMPNMQLWTLKL